jgi:Hint domain
MATTLTWTSAQSGNWNSTTDWSVVGSFPNSAADVALINATGPAYTITFGPSESIASLTISSANATLAFAGIGGGAAGSNTLTTTSGVSLTAGEIDLLNSGAVLTDNSTLGVSSGATIDIGTGSTITANSTTTVGGLIEVNGSLSTGHLILTGLVEATTGTGILNFSSITSTGGGTVEANGATLNMTHEINATSGVAFDVGDSASSVLESTGSINAGNTITFLGALGEFDYNNATATKLAVAGLNVGTGPTNFIDMLGTGLTVTSGGTVVGGGSTDTVVLSNHTTLTLSGVTNGGATWFVKTASDGGSGTDVFLSSVCYAASTRILTATGERMIESLLQGDVVLTLSNEELGAQPVKWIGRRRIDIAAHPRPEMVAPIRIQRGAIADNVPHSDLLVSPDHGILVDDKLICARQLINGTTIRQEANEASVEYFHVELDAHAILLAEGLPAESYLDTGNRNFFANSSGPLVLHPDLTDDADYTTREAASCKPFVWDEGSVRPVWQRLAERAAVLSRPAPKLRTTTDAALCIVAKGRTLSPLYVENGLYVFALPKNTTTVRLTSRAGSPTDARPWLEDRRRLGVYVERIVLRTANEVTDVSLDHPGLTQGWWAVEQTRGSLLRWTNGDALLSLPAADDLTILEIRAGSSGMDYMIDTEEQCAA